jgi:hypothetical protein
MDFLSHQMYVWNKQTEGIGIGLSSVRQLLLLMKGLIRIESEEQVGTRVSIQIPFLCEASALQGQQFPVPLPDGADVRHSSTTWTPPLSKESSDRPSPAVNILTKGSSFSGESVSAIMTPHSLDRMVPAPFRLTVFCVGKHSVIQEMVEYSLAPFVEELTVRWFDSPDVATMHTARHMQEQHQRQPQQQEFPFHGCSVDVMVVDTLSLDLSREELEAYQVEWKSCEIPRVVLIPFDEMMKCRANGLEISMESEEPFSRRLALPCTSDMFRRCVFDAGSSVFLDGPLSKGSRHGVLFGATRSSVSSGEGTPSPLAIRHEKQISTETDVNTRECESTKDGTKPSGDKSVDGETDGTKLHQVEKHRGRSRASVDSAQTHPMEGGRKRKGHAHHERLKGKTPRGCALVVEDELINRKVMERVLKRLRWECEMAEDGLIALTKIKENHSRYDIVFMDVRMDIMGMHPHDIHAPLTLYSLFISHCYLPLSLLNFNGSRWMGINPRNSEIRSIIVAQTCSNCGNHG